MSSCCVYTWFEKEKFMHEFLFSTTKSHLVSFMITFKDMVWIVYNILFRIPSVTNVTEYQINHCLSSKKKICIMLSDFWRCRWFYNYLVTQWYLQTDRPDQPFCWIPWQAGNSLFHGCKVAARVLSFAPSIQPFVLNIKKENAGSFCYYYFFNLLWFSFFIGKCNVSWKPHADFSLCLFFWNLVTTTAVNAREN